MWKLLKTLKPHMSWVVVVLIAHFIQAYTTLLLPDYTSKLVDVGIQNSGVELAVPLKMTPEAYDNFMLLLFDDEQKEMMSNYTQDNSGNYLLKSSIEQNDKKMSELDAIFTTPLAMYQTVVSMNQEQLVSYSSPSTTDTLQSLRDQFNEKMKSFGPATVHATAVKAVVTTAEESGLDLSHRQMSYVMVQGGQMLLIALIAFAVGSVATYIAAVVGAKVGSELRQKTYKKVLAFSNQELETFSTASLITRGTNDVQQVQMVLTIFLRIVLYSPMLSIGAIIYVLQTQLAMSWVTILAITAVAALMGTLMAIVVPRFQRLQGQIDKVNLFAREILTGLQVIRAFGRQDLEKERFDGANADLKGSYIFVGRVMSLMMPIMMLIANGTSIIVIWVASHRISDGLMQVGEMLAYISYTMQVIFSFFMLTMMSIMIPRAIVSINRIDEIIETPLSIKEANEAIVIDTPKGVVEYNHVNFHFEGADENTINDLSFIARPGQTTAIIGGTGSGKSTILNLLMRFYDVNEGRITIDGVDIREISLKQLREMIGYVPQKAVLFSGTIESNIGYGVQNLSEQVRDEAAEIAHAKDFILTKDRGFKDKIAQGGGNVSGGQKQRLSIARAIAKQPKVFLFDDSFSALDYKTDASLRKALNERVSDATVILVAQRINTILDADQIIVLNDGVVDSIGTHLELMKTSEVYQEIARSQLSQAELDNYAHNALEGGNANG